MRFLSEPGRSKGAKPMPKEPIARDQIRAMTGFTVGTLDERDAMMVIECAETPEDYAVGIRQNLPIAMTPKQARKLAEGLLIAANSASMGATANTVVELGLTFDNQARNKHKLIISYPYIGFPTDDFASNQHSFIQSR
jgi:hypothetical protein